MRLANLKLLLLFLLTCAAPVSRASFAAPTARIENVKVSACCKPDTEAEKLEAQSSRSLLLDKTGAYKVEDSQNSLLEYSFDLPPGTIGRTIGILCTGTSVAIAILFFFILWAAKKYELESGIFLLVCGALLSITQSTAHLWDPWWRSLLLITETVAYLLALLFYELRTLNTETNRRFHILKIPFPNKILVLSLVGSLPVLLFFRALSDYLLVAVTVLVCGFMLCSIAMSHRRSKTTHFLSLLILLSLSPSLAALSHMSQLPEGYVTLLVQGPLAVQGFVLFAFIQEKIRRATSRLASQIDELQEENKVLRKEAEKRKEAEAALEANRSMLVHSARMRSIGEMAAGITHEINNPLAIISLRTSNILLLLEQEPPQIEKAIKLVKSIIDVIRRIDRIIRTLRAMSRESTSLPTEVVSLASLVEDSLELCRERFRNHNVQLLVEPVSPELEIQCRPTLVWQVILNLLNNAFDATENQPSRWVRIATANKGSMVEIAVTDSGPGVPTNVRHKLFRPFFSTKNNSKGTGLGLSMSKTIVESHGGRLYYDEKATETKFVVELPKKMNQARSTPPNP